MKKNIFIFVMSLLSIMANAQSKKDTVGIDIGSMVSNLQIVDHFENNSRIMDDVDFDARNYEVLTNRNEFVKDLIGLDSDSTYLELINEYPLIIKKINSEHDSIIIRDNPYTNPITINGHSYKRFFRNKYNVQIESLKEIAKKHNITGDCIYMINGHIVLKDPYAYKVVLNNIAKINVTKSSDIKTIDKSKNFVILKIYTKQY